MTKTEKNVWLKQKRWELWRISEKFPEHVIEAWDQPKFLEIIGNMEREIRKLKTKLAAK